MSTPTMEAVKTYIKKGFMPVPIPSKEKGPILKGWQKLRITDDEIPKYFSGNVNNGLILGEPSGWLIDIDLDCPEAVAAAPLILPHTDMKSGRESSKESHYWYIAQGSKSDTSFIDPEEKKDKAKMVELRSTGLQTMVPPSIHPSGEQVKWYGALNPSTQDSRTLQAAVSELAVVSLMARRWLKGIKQDMALLLSGALASGGIPIEQAERIMEAISTAAQDEKPQVKLKALRQTYEKHKNGEQVTGIPKFKEFVGDKVFERFSKWLNLRETTPEKTEPTSSPVGIIEVKPLHERLQEKWDRDRQRKPGELLGYKMKDLGTVAEKCDGIQPGFYIIGAYTNIGKTALLVNMFLDLLHANPETTGIYFSLDDNEDIIINRFLALLTGLPINACQRPQTMGTDKESLIDKEYTELIDMSKEGRLFLYDIGSVNHINGFRNIVMEHSDKKLIIAIDGLYNLQVGDGRGYGGIREENIERANQVKAMVDMWKIPVLTTAEVRKPSDSKKINRPTLHDLMESSKFAYNANLVWILHPPTLNKEEKSPFKDEVEKFNQEPEPIINLWYEKNKMSEFKGRIELRFEKKTGSMSLVKNAEAVFDC